ncbi:RagB/SusD family nutrient uptake outer membrane protein [Robertkochia flava]|uniref:RagB/SusD family nutrient uptake outer membrane protein n=1 Tax=Robertkochia flava TaxID=3447986 RepID=UPI001CCE2F4C|nr:RagB/SusD family nutrient uptake outer membrane protein [Robertkochia marina]
MKNKIIVSLIAGAVSLVGCSKDFLETEPTEFISSDQVNEAVELNPELGVSYLNGLYVTMFTPGTGGTTRHDDFGQKGYDIFSDMLSSDMVLGGLNYGWYTYISEMQSTVDFTSSANAQVWRYYYTIIRGANTVIEGLGGNDITLTDAGSRHVMGQAKAMRAYAYFYLAQYFAEGYNPSQPILPIYTDTDAPNQPLSTTQEVYSLMVDDLTEAAEYLADFNRDSKSQIDQYVAKGLLVYVYAAMGDDAMAKPLAKDIVDNGGFALMSAEEVTGVFNDINTPGWMWGIDITLDNNLDLISWWGQMDVFTYSYAWVGDVKSIDDDLFASIAPEDIRKTQFEDVYGIDQRAPVNKFYAPGRTIGGQRSVTTDYIYMRVAEFYLLHAETAAKTGDEAAAKATLKALLEQRVPDASYIDALSGQALLDEIYLQTRIELWGEGKSYLAMKRNRATITRGPNHLSFPGESFTYDDDRLTFEIPQSEIQNNPNIN